MEDKFNIKKHTMFIPDQVYRRAVRALIKSVTQREYKPIIKQKRGSCQKRRVLMIDKFLPAHVLGRKFDTLANVQETIDQKGLDIGGSIRISTKKDSQISSIAYQEKLLREWAELQNYNLKEVYIDMK